MDLQRIRPGQHPVRLNRMARQVQGKDMMRRKKKAKLLGSMLSQREQTEVCEWMVTNRLHLAKISIFFVQSAAFETGRQTDCPSLIFIVKYGFEKARSVKGNE